LWRSCEFLGIIVDVDIKTQPEAIAPEKVVVEKAAFDAVLEKLIKSKPVKRA
jgi:hypothetical protein